MGLKGEGSEGRVDRGSFRMGLSVFSRAHSSVFLPHQRADPAGSLAILEHCLENPALDHVGGEMEQVIPAENIRFACVGSEDLKRSYGQKTHLM